MSDVSRFRIRPECLDEMLAALRAAGIEPSAVYKRHDGEVAVEVVDVTEQQAKAFFPNFRVEWSAIIGIVGGSPIETEH